MITRPAGTRQMKNFASKGTHHEHEAQQPEKLDVAAMNPKNSGSADMATDCLLAELKKALRPGPARQIARRPSREGKSTRRAAPMPRAGARTPSPASG